MSNENNIYEENWTFIFSEELSGIFIWNKNI